MSETLDPSKPITLSQIKQAREEVMSEVTDGEVPSVIGLTKKTSDKVALNGVEFTVSKKITVWQRSIMEEARESGSLKKTVETLQLYLVPEEREAFLTFVMDEEDGPDLEDITQFITDVEELVAARPKKK